MLLSGFRASLLASGPVGAGAAAAAGLLLLNQANLDRVSWSTGHPPPGADSAGFGRPAAAFANLVWSTGHFEILYNFVSKPHFLKGSLVCVLTLSSAAFAAAAIALWSTGQAVSLFAQNQPIMTIVDCARSWKKVYEKVEASNQK